MLSRWRTTTGFGIPRYIWFLRILSFRSAEFAFIWLRMILTNCLESPDRLWLQHHNDFGNGYCLLSETGRKMRMLENVSFEIDDVWLTDSIAMCTNRTIWRYIQNKLHIRLQKLEQNVHMDFSPVSVMFNPLIMNLSAGSLAGQPAWGIPMSGTETWETKAQARKAWRALVCCHLEGWPCQPAMTNLNPF